MPKTLRDKSKITAIECEPIGFKILKTLHPDIKNYQQTNLRKLHFQIIHLIW